jgi:hypothetical protein
MDVPNDGAFAFLSNHTRRHVHALTAWQLLVSHASSSSSSSSEITCSVLDRPNYDATGRSELIYLDPVMGASTAAEADIHRMVVRVHKELVVDRGHEYVGLVGDFQTFKNMCLYKVRHGRTADWLVPKPGEWHAWVHWLMAIHFVFFDVLLVNFIKDLNLLGIVKNWDTTSTANRYRFLHEHFIDGATSYLVEIIPVHLLKNPEVLLAIVSENEGEWLLIIFFKT